MALRVEPFVPALRDLADILNPRGIAWAVAGAVAANNYRDETRTTSDLDVLLTLAADSITDIQDAMHKRGWKTTALVPEGFLLRVEHSNHGRIDLLVSQTDYEDTALTRAQSAALGADLRFKTLAVEDVVILKLIANRYRDVADVESILSAKPALDWSYLTRWFAEFDLDDRYQRIEAGALASGLIDAENTRAAADTPR